jgi:hypothetical protein
MKRTLFSKGNHEVQVGGLNTAKSVYLAADTASDAFAADTVIEVRCESSVWVAIGTAPTATATTDGNALFPAGVSRPFRIDSGNKIIATGAINVTVVD